MVDSKAPKRQSAAAGLAIRGAMMGADAVVDLNEERLPGFLKTEHRASGVAVRAVDDEGRLELKTRWFARRISQIAVVMLAVACLELLVDFGTAFATWQTQASAVRVSASYFRVLNLGGGLVIAGLSAGLVFGKWPQLVRPTALCFLSKTVGIVLSLLSTIVNSAVIGSFLFGTAPPPEIENTSAIAIAATFGGAGMLILSTIVTTSLLVFYLYLGRTAWRIDQEYRSLAGRPDQVASIPASREWLSRIAWSAAIYYALVYVGDSVNNIYAGVALLREMPKSYAVIKSSTGVQISGNPQEWNNRAWSLATAADPNLRDPAEALRLAEQAVAAKPKSADYYNTLGVARYRSGDFRGAIDALKYSFERSGRRAHDAFFLAMAYARLGDHDDARAWYTTADGWMRQNKPNDAELRRFRVEAVAVLDVADDGATRSPPRPEQQDAAGSNREAPGGKAK
jgi:hypothetical protein